MKSLFIYFIRTPFHILYHAIAYNIWESVFRVSEKARLKPVQSPQLLTLARKFEISLVASLDKALSKKCITKALNSLCGCAGWSVLFWFANPKEIFLRQGPYICHIHLRMLNVFYIMHDPCIALKHYSYRLHWCL